MADVQATGYRSIGHRIADAWKSPSNEGLRSSALEASFLKYVGYVLAASGAIVIFVLAKKLEFAGLGFKAEVNTAGDLAAALRDKSDLVIPYEYAVLVAIAFLAIVAIVLILAILTDVGDDHDTFLLFREGCKAIVYRELDGNHGSGDLPPGMVLRVAGFITWDRSASSVEDSLKDDLNAVGPRGFDRADEVREARALFRRYRWYIRNKALTYLLVGVFAFLAALCAAFFLFNALRGPSLTDYLRNRQAPPVATLPATNAAAQPGTTAPTARHPVIIAAFFDAGQVEPRPDSPLFGVRERLADAFRDCSRGGVVPSLLVVGHADSRCIEAGCGTTADRRNAELATRRAERVRALLADALPKGVAIETKLWTPAEEAMMRADGGFSDLTGDAPATRSRPEGYSPSSGHLLRRADLMIVDAAKCDLGAAIPAILPHPAK